MGRPPGRQVLPSHAGDSGRRRDVTRRLVVISPHLDDAVLSAWSALRHHSDVAVVTCFAGEPPAGTPASVWDRRGGARCAVEQVRLRRAEDQAVMNSLGATAVHLEHLDAPYRDPGDDMVLERLTDSLRPHLGRDALVLAPLALGGHPDHVAAREAALAAAPRGRLLLYADLPYASRWGWPAWVRRGRGRAGVQLRPLRGRSTSKQPALVWARTLRQVRVRGAAVHRLDDRELMLKRHALAAYTTEAPLLGLDGLVGGEDALRYEVRWAVRA